MYNIDSVKSYHVSCLISTPSVSSFSIPLHMRGELKQGISLRRKQLNRKVRHGTREALQHAEYKRVVKTLYEVDFT